LVLQQKYDDDPINYPIVYDLGQSIFPSLKLENPTLFQVNFFGDKNLPHPMFVPEHSTKKQLHLSSEEQQLFQKIVSNFLLFQILPLENRL